jgi:hypothetical protein
MREAAVVESPTEAIALDAEGVFRTCEARLLAARVQLRFAIAAMTALALEYRKELRGYRLVLYLKARPDNPDTFALYWAVLAKPREDHRGRSGKSVPCWTYHLAGGLNDIAIFQSAEAGLKGILFDFDRRAKTQNDAYHILTGAIDAGLKMFEARWCPRPWEREAPNIQAPTVSEELPPRYQGALGALWGFLLRMGIVQADLRSLVEGYQAAPIQQHLTLKFVHDGAHPYGRVRWHHYGAPLVRVGGSGTQDRLTDEWMRKIGRIPESKRRILAGVEAERMRLLRCLRRYTRVLAAFKQCTGDALFRTRGSLAHAATCAQEVG